MLEVLVIALMVVPAILLWTAPGKRKGIALISLVVGVLWLLVVHSLVVIPLAWERWHVCLAPAQVYEGASGGDGTAPDECTIYDP